MTTPSMFPNDSRAAGGLTSSPPPPLPGSSQEAMDGLNGPGNRSGFNGLGVRDGLDRPFAADAPEPAPKRGGFFGPLLALLFFGFKYVKIALSSGKFLAIGQTFLTMAISTGAYAMLNGWAFAAVFIALLFAHEMGHVWAARRIGLPVSAPMFIPFLGAAITMKKHPQSVSHEAYVAVGGPILGTVGCVVTMTLAWMFKSEFLFHMAMVGHFLNLFNLVPLSPLDGGRIVAAISPWLWVLGGLIMVPLLIWMGAWIFLVLIAFMAWPQIRSLFSERNREWKVYHATTKRQRVYASAAWVSMGILIGFSLLVSVLGAKDPTLPVLGLGTGISWVLTLFVGGICFFTWPLESARNQAFIAAGRFAVGEQGSRPASSTTASEFRG